MLVETKWKLASDFRNFYVRDIFASISLSECLFVLDSSAAEFRRQPETCRAAEKKFGAPPNQPKFMSASSPYFSRHTSALVN